MDGLMTLPVQMQVALGAGYMAYATAWSGMRDQHKAIDTAAISLAFSVIAITILQATVDSIGVAASAAAAVAATVGGGAAWRRWGQHYWRKLLGAAKISRHMGYSSAEAFLLYLHKPVSQIGVFLKDGTKLYCTDVALVTEAGQAMTEGGFYFAEDGSIVMHVDEITLPDGTEVSEQQVIAGDWGAKATCIKADMISHYYARLQQK